MKCATLLHLLFTRSQHIILAAVDQTQEFARTPNIQRTETSDYGNLSAKGTQQTITLDGIRKKSEIRRFLDKFITKLLLAPTEGMPNKLVLLELKELCLRCRELFLSESALLLINPPIYILGDLHGQFTDLVTMLSKLGMPPRCRYLFLGDYVDRGNWSLETVSLLMAYKLRYPQQIFMLRGNHETRAVNRVYGFFEECTKRFPERGEGTILWTLYQHVFNCLPLAAVVGERIFAAHGGISEDLKCWRQFSRIRRPTDVTDIGLINDLIWSDPCDACERYAESPRGVSQVFGKVAIDEFEDALNVDLIVRAHQVVMDGYEFFHNKRCLTIFSAPCYCGEMNNIAGILFVNAKLECSIFTYRSPNRAPEDDENQGNESLNKQTDGEVGKQESESKENAIIAANNGKSIRKEDVQPEKRIRAGSPIPRNKQNAGDRENIKPSKSDEKKGKLESRDEKKDDAEENFELKSAQQNRQNNKKDEKEDSKRSEHRSKTGIDSKEANIKQGQNEEKQAAKENREKSSEPSNPAAHQTIVF
uniref:Serine/threonine-protein phosphatase n=1 Tax=Ascaris lumbricoides TaxID=6252 RepID=A0A0M3I154_ASCLU